MAQAMLVALAAALYFAGVCSAVDYSLGAWNLKRTKDVYKAAIANINFQPGDTLKFEYASGHNVYHLETQEAYDTCDLSKPLMVYKDPNPVVTLAKGKNFFVCGVADHCNQGMKVTVKVGITAAAPGPSANPPQENGVMSLANSFITLVAVAGAAIAFFF